ncbi:hypothetical protein ACRE1U_05575 [Helicobacter himalayensis]|uniref:hypothetical protein n=1 Tax=Helicobacter himalayensis TaxID=1591088 RepID=UPI003D6E9319
MAVSFVGNITYINQNTQASSVALSNAQARPDIVQEASLNEFERKLQEIESITPADEAQSINKDGGGSNGAYADSNTSENKEEDKKEQEIRYHYNGLLNVRA